MLQKLCNKTLAFADSSENIASLHAGIRVHVGILEVWVFITQRHKYFTFKGKLEILPFVTRRDGLSHFHVKLHVDFANLKYSILYLQSQKTPLLCFDRTTLFGSPAEIEIPKQLFYTFQSKVCTSCILYISRG